MIEASDLAQVVIRRINPETDLPFIYSSWRNSLWNDSHRPEAEAKEFFGYYTKKIKKLLSHPKAYVSIAVLKDDHDFILGYSVVIDTNLEWVYVKLDYRKRGVGELVAGAFQTISQPKTKIGLAIARKKHCVTIEERDYARRSESPSQDGPPTQDATNQSRASEA